jgi:hypothetical protein
LEGLGKRKWIAITLAAVIVPISLLTTLKLTGIISEAITPETFMVEAKTWNGERGLVVTAFNEKIANSYSDDLASINFEVTVGTYVVGDSTWNYLDYLNMHISASANTSKGFIYSMSVQFLKGNNYTSAIGIFQDPELLELHNLQMGKVLNSWSGSEEAYITTTAKAKPSECQLIFNVNWIFLNQNVDDNVTATLETTYFNGTSYQKTMIPIHFSIQT